MIVASPQAVRAFRVVLAVVFSLFAAVWFPRPLAVATVAAAALFGAGSRLGYAGVVVAVVWFAWHGSVSHDLAPLPITVLIGWLFVPWHVPDKEPTAEYGFAFWWPSLALGMAFASAAWAKLWHTSGAWVTGGAVRYIFVFDAQNRHTDLGLTIAGSRPWWVLVSLGAVVIEFTIIAAAIYPRRWVRLAAFGGTIALLAGFWLFQGMFWPLWWVCALALLPWGLMRAERVMMPRAQLVFAAAFVLMQIAVDARDREVMPWVTNYPMYSTSYESTEQFDDEHRQRFSRIVGTTDPALAAFVRNLSQDEQNSLMRLSERVRPSSDDRARICGTVLNEVGRLQLVVLRRRFDWSQGRFTPEEQMVLPVVHVRDFCAG